METYNQFMGLNTVDSEGYMGDNELIDLTNMELRDRGSIRRRSGIVNHTRRAIWGDIKGKNWGDL